MTHGRREQVGRPGSGGRAGAVGWPGLVRPVRLVPLVALALACGAATPRTASAEPAAATAPKALDEFFNCRVTALDAKSVTLHYDFNKKEQAKDWLDRIPYRIQQRKDQGISWFDDKLQIIGNAGARHVAEWMGDVLVTATFVPDMERDFGGYLSPVTETEDFASFTFVETYFHAFDGQAGGTNSIIKFGAQWREGDSGEDFTGFRYVSRKPPRTKIAIGKPIRASFGIQHKKLVFNIGDEQSLKGADKGKRLKRFRVGFYAIKGRLLLDNVEITGQLAADWLKRENVELRTKTPVGAAPSGEVDAATHELIQQHTGGNAKASRDLVAIVKDESRGDAVREAVVTALCSGPKKTVQYVIDLLYHPQEKVRDYGIRVVKALLGKDYGYKAKSSEKNRRAAIQKLNDDLRDHPNLLEG